MRLRLICALTLAAAATAHADRYLPVVAENGSFTVYSWDDDGTGGFTYDYTLWPCDEPYAVTHMDNSRIAYVACISTGEVLEIKTDSRQILTVDSVVGGHPHDVLHNDRTTAANRTKLYVSSLRAGKISEYTLSSATRRDLTIADIPWHLALSRDGSLLYVATINVNGNLGRLFRVDVAAWTATELHLNGNPTEVWGGLAVDDDGTLVATGQTSDRVYYIGAAATCAAACAFGTASAPDLSFGVAHDSQIGETWVPSFGDVHVIGRPISFPIGIAYAPRLHHGGGDWLFVADWLNGTVEVFETLSLVAHQATLNIGWYSLPRDLDVSGVIWRATLQLRRYIPVEFGKLGVVYRSPLAIKNLGQEAAVMGAASIEGPAALAIADGCRGRSLKNGETCTIEVRCTPTEAKKYAGTLTVRSNGALASEPVEVVCAPK